jgi:hypothetical protein
MDPHFHLNTIAFAHLLPISLALFGRYAPKAINATIIGLYYLAFFLANSLVGWVGGFYQTMPTTPSGCSRLASPPPRDFALCSSNSSSVITLKPRRLGGRSRCWC